MALRHVIRTSPPRAVRAALGRRTLPRSHRISSSATSGPGPSTACCGIVSVVKPDGAPVVYPEALRKYLAEGRKADLAPSTTFSVILPGLHLKFRHIPGDANPADGLSRGQMWEMAFEEPATAVIRSLKDGHSPRSRVEEDI